MKAGQGLEVQPAGQPASKSSSRSRTARALDDAAVEVPVASSAGPAQAVVALCLSSLSLKKAVSTARRARSP